MTSNRTILVLVEYGWRNGGENSWLAVAPWLRDAGWRFVVACPSVGEFSDSVSRGGWEKRSWCCTDENGIRRNQEQTRSEIATLIKHCQPAIVHANSLSTSRLAGPVTHFMRVPSVGCLRDILKLSRQAVADINRLNRTVAVSHATREYHLQQGLDANRSTVIYNGVDTAAFRPSQPTGYLHHQLQLSPGRRLVSCIGQIGLRKGTAIVIQAFIELCQHVNDIELLISGIRNSRKQEAIEYEQACRQSSRNCDVSDRIHWLGRRTDVADILRESSLLLHGARQEPLGRVLLEAMASGCPFVATMVGGTAEIVAGSDCEWLTCRVDDVTKMAENARNLLSRDTAATMEIRQQLVGMAKSRFEASICAAAYDRLYHDLLACSAAPGPLP